jgi:hypothetical protein
MSDILWPQGYVPGFTDNFCSNEVIVTGLALADAWPFLDTPARWPTYYANAADVRLHDARGLDVHHAWLLEGSCPAAGCASSRRKPSAAGRRPNWPGRGRTR